MKREIILTTLAVVVLCLQTPAASPPHYLFSRAGDYPGATDTYPRGVNLSQIVGDYIPQGNGGVPAGYVQTRDNQFVTAQPAGAFSSYLFAINSTGLAVGEYCLVCAGR